MVLKRLYFTCVLCILGLAGCTLGPDYRRPHTQVHDSDGYVNTPMTLAEALDGSAGGRWWEKMNDPLMNEYVTLLLQQNLQLKEAAARIYQSSALLGIQKGGLLPELLATFSGSRWNLPRSDAFPHIPNAVNQDESLSLAKYESGLSISWQIDLFGKVRRGIESAEALFGSSKADAEALVHSLIAELARGRVGLATLKRQLEVAAETVESRRITLDAVERRYRLGTPTAVDVYLARETLAAARADEADLSRQFMAQAYAMDVLLGYNPGYIDPNAVNIPFLPPPETPPLGLPAQLLDRRPDLRSAELRLKAATAQIGVAIADLLPDLTLSGSAGYLSEDIKSMFKSSNLFTTIIGEIMGRIFEGGRLRNNIEFRKAQTEEQAALYAGRILNALLEVETALSNERFISLRIDELEIQLENIRKAEELAWGNYRSGLRPLLDLIEVQRRRYIVEQTYLMAAQSAWNSRIQLYLALGGDWMT